jgi:hypothetical protein
MNLTERRRLFDSEIEIMSNNPLLSSPFYLRSDYTLPVTLVLTPKAVYYHSPDNKLQRKGFLITFDTIFQAIRQKSKEEKTLGPSLGIKFIAPLCESE